MYPAEIAPQWLLALVIWFTSPTGYFTSVLTRAERDHSGQKKRPGGAVSRAMQPEVQWNT